MLASDAWWWSLRWLCPVNWPNTRSNLYRKSILVWFARMVNIASPRWEIDFVLRTQERDAILIAAISSAPLISESRSVGWSHEIYRNLQSFFDYFWISHVTSTESAVQDKQICRFGTVCPSRVCKKSDSQLRAWREYGQIIFKKKQNDLRTSEEDLDDYLSTKSLIMRWSIEMPLKITWKLGVRGTSGKLVRG